MATIIVLLEKDLMNSPNGYYSMILLLILLEKMR